MKQVGKTQDDIKVVSDVFEMVGTRGLPLEMVLQFCKDNGWIVSWPHYVRDARKDGAKMKSIKAKVFAAVGEVYGPFYLKGFQARWEEYFNEAE